MPNPEQPADTDRRVRELEGEILSAVLRFIRRHPHVGRERLEAGIRRAVVTLEGRCTLNVLEPRRLAESDDATGAVETDRN